MRFSPFMERRKILIVEDNASLLDILIQFVKRAGYQPLVADTGAAALAWISVTRPDLILIDLGLPDMTGESVIESLKADPRTRAVPIIVQTAFESNERTDRALDIGADEVMVKPINLKTITEVLRRYLPETATQ
jgi:two-component system phosphate regulon response regulator PhoB